MTRAGGVAVQVVPGCYLQTVIPNFGTDHRQFMLWTSVRCGMRLGSEAKICIPLYTCISKDVVSYERYVQKYVATQKEEIKSDQVKNFDEPL